MKKYPIVSDSFRLVEWSQFDQRYNAFLGDGSQQAAILCAKATSFHSFGAEDLRVSVFLGSWRSKICIDFLMAKYIHWRSKSWTKINIWIHELRICPMAASLVAEEKTPDHLRPSYGFNSFTPGTPLYQQGRRNLRGRLHGDVDLNIDACIYTWIYIYIYMRNRQEMSFPFMAFRVEMIFEYPDDSRLLYIVR